MVVRKESSLVGTKVRDLETTTVVSLAVRMAASSVYESDEMTAVALAAAKDDERDDW